MRSMVSALCVVLGCATRNTRQCPCGGADFDGNHLRQRQVHADDDYFAADRLKMDMGSIAVIYRADTGAVFNIMKDQKKYIAFDPATQQRMGAMMSECKSG